MLHLHSTPLHSTSGPSSWGGRNTEQEEWLNTSGSGGYRVQQHLLFQDSIQVLNKNHKIAKSWPEYIFLVVKLFQLKDCVNFCQNLNCQNLSFYFCHNLIFLKSYHDYKMFKYCSYLSCHNLIFEFCPIMSFEFCHNLCFSLMSQFRLSGWYLSFVF